MVQMNTLIASKSTMTGKHQDGGLLGNELLSEVDLRPNFLISTPRRAAQNVLSDAAVH